MNKVYILFKEHSYSDFQQIHGIFSSLISAKKEKSAIEKRKKELGKQYFDKYGYTLKQDSKEFFDDSVVERYYDFLNNNPEVEIHNLYVQEHNVV